MTAAAPTLDTAPDTAPETPPAGARVDDLAQIISSYNAVTEKLQRSHEALRAQVARLEQQLASTDAQLRRSKQLAALGQMAAGIAHEIRNPLGAIRLYASMVADDLQLLHLPAPDRDTVDASRQNVETIVVAVRGLDALVHDVLRFAHEIKPSNDAVAVCDLFERALAMAAPDIEGAGVEVMIDAHAALAVCVDGDLMNQALVNLLRNAVQAIVEMPSDQAPARPRRIVLTAAAESCRVVLSVTDTGQGIAPEAVDRIFNPFFTTRSTGTGLGLAIVHRIVDAHGGTISVGKDPGTGGAVFQMRLAQATTADETGTRRGGLP